MQVRRAYFPGLCLAVLMPLTTGILNAQGVSLAARTTTAVGGGPQAIVMGDFNGDGITDVATANRSGDTVSVLLGNGDGSFRAAPRLTESISFFSSTHQPHSRHLPGHS